MGQNCCIPRSRIYRPGKQKNEETETLALRITEDYREKKTCAGCEELRVKVHGLENNREQQTNAEITTKDKTIHDLKVRIEKLIAEKGKEANEKNQLLQSPPKKRKCSGCEELSEMREKVQRLEKDEEHNIRKQVTDDEVDKKKDKEISALKVTIEEFKATNNSKDSQIEDLNTKVADLTTKVEDLTANLKTSDEKNESQFQVIQKFQDSSDKKAKKLDELSNAVTELKQQLKESEDSRILLLKSVAAEMEKTVGGNEEDLENVSRPNRSMKIAEDYVYFCSNQWLDAKTELDNTCQHVGEKIKLLYLSLLVQESLAACGVEKDKRLDSLRKQPGAKNDASDNKELLQAMRDENTLSENDIERMMQMIVTSVTSATSTEKLSFKVKKKERKELGELPSKCMTNQYLQNYIKEALILCWRMITQMPPMTFECEGVGQPYKGEQFQDIQWGSEDPSDPKNVVLFYTQPTVKHGQHVMTKGKVFCGPKHEHDKISERLRMNYK